MSKFDLLMRLAQDKLDAAADRMRRAQQQHAQAQNTLAQVESFIADYQQKLVQQGRGGMSVAQWADYRLFMQKLDDARLQQEKEVERCEQWFLLEKQAWLQERKKLKSFEVLKAREAERELLRQKRQEQKQLDEFAARSKRTQ